MQYSEMIPTSILLISIVLYISTLWYTIKISDEKVTRKEILSRGKQVQILTIFFVLFAMNCIINFLLFKDERLISSAIHGIFFSYSTFRFLMWYWQPNKEAKKLLIMQPSKVWVGNDIEDMKRIQERLIELGCYWQIGDNEKEKIVKYLGQSTCIFIDTKLRLSYLNTTDKVFKESYHTEIKQYQLFN